MKRINAFTLIELLIVIGIIGILTVVPIMTYGSITKNSRDVRRKQDIDRVNAAILRYRNENGQFPNTATYAGLSAYLVPGSFARMPADPQAANAPGGVGYVYTVQSNGLSYTLYTRLERRLGSNNEIYTVGITGGRTITGVPSAPTSYLSPTGGSPLTTTPGF